WVAMANEIGRRAPKSAAHEALLSRALNHINTRRDQLNRVETGRSRFAWPVMPKLLKAVIYCLKPRHPTLPLLPRFRRQRQGQREILVKGGCRSSEPRITAWT